MQADRIRKAFGRILKPDIAVDVRPIDTMAHSPFPVERTAMAQAVPSRRAEFFSGRIAARATLETLGIPAQAIAQGPDRAPVWPEGITGSISHCKGLVAAIAGHQPPYKSLGLDIENDAPLDAALWPEILTDQDHGWLQNSPEHHQGSLAKQLFSIKECTYKAQYPLSGTMLEFSAFSVELSLETGLFDAVFQHPAPPFQTGDRLQGVSVVEAGLILSVIWL